MTSIEKTNRVCAVIPFYNEERFIKKVVTDTLKYVDKIIAVNDGSTDKSIEHLQSIPGVEIINLKKNNGKGFALQQGFEEALNRNIEFIITLDGDGQHPPESIPLLLNKIENFDIVIGNRLDDLSSMPIHRRLSNKLTSFLLSKKLGTKIYDSQSGFRIYKQEVLRKIKTVFSGFEAESEILVKAVRNGFKVGFINIPTIYGDEKSKMKSMQAIKGFIKVMLS